MEPSIFKILIVVLLLVLLFGRGKISGFMEDLGKGVSAFKKGVREGEDEAEKKADAGEETSEPPKQITDARSSAAGRKKQKSEDSGS